MVVRHDRKDRKYFGTRRWGAGNIKNRRGGGSKGGRGNAGSRKHKFTWMTAKHPELIKHVGFTPWKPGRSKLDEITLKEVDRIISRNQDNTVELEGYKVLSNGTLSRKITIKASGFSKPAMEKIKRLGGEAVVL